MAVPQVLWKLFRKRGQNKARTLAKTVVSLIPPPPSMAERCRCRDPPCIRCCGADVMSFLLRPDDPSDYRDLLTRGYVVVNNGAPDLSKLVPSSSSTWSQAEVVAHTIEMVERNTVFPNVIFSGYDKDSRSSTIVELLTSSAWCTLLTRVGETIMIYLLMHTSIFLQQPNKMYFQVAGSPISALCKSKYLEYKSMDNQGHPSPKGRKRAGAFNGQNCTKRRRLSHQEMVNTNEEVPQDCCLQFLTSQGVDEQAQIDKKSIFYNREHSSSVFPKKHILNSLKPDHDGSDLLLKNIFGLRGVNVLDKSCSYRRRFSFTGSSCLYPALAKTLRDLIQRTKRCQHWRLLNKHCPIPDHTKMFKESKSRADTEHNKSLHEAINSYSSKSQVVSFIWAVCRSIIPPVLLGACFNWRELKRNIAKFIRLRRFETFYFKQCMHNLDTYRFLSKNCKRGIRRGAVLHKGSSDAVCTMKHKLIQQWIFWLFSSIVVPLVQTHFYVTESEHGRQDVYYYRKSVWRKLTNEAFSHLGDQNYSKVGVEEVRSISKSRNFGFSKLRLRPNENQVRMLANLKAPSNLPQIARYNNKGIRYYRSVNVALHDTHVIFKDLKLKNPEMLGSSVFGYNDIYRQFCPFVLGLKNELGYVPDVFIVTCDVSKAFDSVKQDKLLAIMEELRLEREFKLHQSEQVIFTKKCQWRREVTGLTRFVSSAFIKSSSIVIVDNDKVVKMKRKDLLFTVKEHVTRNIVQIGKEFYKQGVGIPQGSILSSLLCSLYYGHLEKNVVYPLLENARDFEDSHIRPSYKLLRFVDDFLFISTSKEQASRFLSCFQEGFRDYNCYMNETKFSMNFGAEASSSRLQVVEDSTSFLCWSGLLINTRSLEVQADYSSYLKNHLCSTLTVGWGDKPGSYHMNKKLLSLLRPKSHPIFFDSNINSAAIVRLNVYQAFLLTAMKASCYLREISSIYKVDTQLCLRIIKKSLRYMYLLLKKMKEMDFGLNLHPRLEVEEEEVEWLGLNAYIKALTKKNSRHKELLPLLRSKLRAHRVTERVSWPLTYAIDDCHSSVMWKIRY